MVGQGWNFGWPSSPAPTIRNVSRETRAPLLSHGKYSVDICKTWFHIWRAKRPLNDIRGFPTISTMWENQICSTLTGRLRPLGSAIITLRCCKYKIRMREREGRDEAKRKRRESTFVRIKTSTIYYRGETALNFWISRNDSDDRWQGRSKCSMLNNTHYSHDKYQPSQT